MTTTSISWIWKLLLVLLLTPSCVHGLKCLEVNYKLLLNGYNVYLAKVSHAAFKSFKVESKMECAFSCMNEEFCQVWRIDNGNCHMFHSLLDKVTVNYNKYANQLTYYEFKEDNNWTKTYFIQEGSGFKGGPSFLGIGPYTSWGPTSCTKNFCSNFFRNLLLDIWSYLPIKKVKLSLYKNNTEILYLIFDGQGTNLKSWFSMSQVLESPWKDVHKGAVNNEFNIDLNSLRSFYISKLHNGCANDLGWLAVIEPKSACTWDSQPVYPTIIYSNKDEATQWGKDKVKRFDNEVSSGNDAIIFLISKVLFAVNG